jgi:hypothetical protein
MKIKSIRIRELVSRPHSYGHDAAEIEAALEPGDDPAQVAADLRALVQAENRRGRECDTLRDTLDGLRDRVRREELLLQRLQAQVVAAQEIIRSHARIQAMAEAAGIPWTDAGETLPGLLEGMKQAAMAAQPPEEVPDFYAVDDAVMPTLDDAMADAGHLEVCRVLRARWLAPRWCVRMPIAGADGTIDGDEIESFDTEDEAKAYVRGFLEREATSAKREQP